MKEILDWLIRIELRTAGLYDEASRFFSDDPGLAGLLKELAEDERAHHAAMSAAREKYQNAPPPGFDITVDEETRRWIERPYVESEEKLRRCVLARDEFLGYLVEIEFSELNHIFLYMLNMLKKDPTSSETPTHNAEEHRKRIERFLVAEPGADGLAHMIRRLPRVSAEKILLVDDDAGTLELLKALLETEAEVDTASDGKAAFGKLVTRYFSAIVTDVDMPVMNGLELYAKAAARFPAIRRRFLFFTAGSDAERINFFRQNKLNYLVKPASIKAIKSAVAGILAAVDPKSP